MGSLGFLQQVEEKKEGVLGEGKTTDSSVKESPPPQSAKPPPPKLPSALSRDKRLGSINETAEKGISKGKGKDKGKPKVKSSTSHSTKGSKYPIEIRSVAQDDRANSEYTSYTARERNWGVLKKQEEWGGKMLE